jgi:large subunit ribosomal protein L10
MPNAEKVEKIAALKERIEGSEALLLTEYRGLTVHDATELRRSLSDQARFSVTKNTLLKRAADEAGIEGLDELLTGTTAVAFVQGDVVTTAKRLVEAAKRFPALVLKGAYMEGKVLGAADARALADLESREVMLSKVAGMLKSEMSRAASMFQALQSRFVGLMEALKDKLPPEPEPVAEPEPEAVETTAEPEAGAVETTVAPEPEVPEEASAGAGGGSAPTETEASTDDAGAGPPTEPAGASPDDSTEEEE